jgi:hypothetical protein
MTQSERFDYILKLEQKISDDRSKQIVKQAKITAKQRKIELVVCMAQSVSVLLTSSVLSALVAVENAND